ncbi:MAG: winged helix-turn-helix domain-containing protein [Planctomycetaceae bacterium]
MASSRQNAPSLASQCRPRLKLWLEFEGEHVFCSGMCQILQAVEKTGSIKDAATAIGKSYRFVWDKIKRSEKALGQTLVDAQVGGRGPRRSSLSPLGTQLVQEFLTLRKELLQLADSHFATTKGKTAKSRAR